MAATTPPLALPSSLVTMSPVSPTAASNALTCASAFCPVLASSTSSDSCGAPGSALASTRLTLRSSSIRCACVGSRPAVSASTTSIPRALAALTASNITEAASPAGLLDHRDVVALAPDHELLARRGAEGVAGRQEHRQALLLQPLGELADGGGLPGAVHAGQHDHERPLGADHQWLLDRGDEVHHGRDQLGPRIGALPRLPPPGLEVFQQVLGGVHADVAGQQRGLPAPRAPRRRACAGGTRRSGRRTSLLPRQAQPGFQPVRPRALRRGLGRRRLRDGSAAAGGATGISGGTAIGTSGGLASGGASGGGFLLEEIEQRGTGSYGRLARGRRSWDSTGSSRRFRRAPSHRPARPHHRRTLPWPRRPLPQGRRASAPRPTASGRRSSIGSARTWRSLPTLDLYAGTGALSSRRCPAARPPRSPSTATRRWCGPSPTRRATSARPA